MTTFGRDEMYHAVDLFADAMRAELERNMHKPDWRDDDLPGALTDLLYHCAKLTAAVTFRDWIAVREYTADVANMAMIVGDVAGVLDGVQAEEPVLIGNVVLADRAFDVSEPPRPGDAKSEGVGKLTEDLGSAGRDFLVRVQQIIQDVRSEEWVEGTAGKVGPL